MSKRIFFVAVVIMLSFGLPAAYGLDAGKQKVGVLQKIKNAYNDFRVRQQQKTQAVKSEAPKQLPTPAKIAASKVESPKVELPQAVAPKAHPKDKEMTKEEMLTELKENFAGDNELFDMVPELVASTGQNGNTVYTYKNIALDELSKEDLAKLYIKVNQALVKIRTDRIQRQLETVRQVEKLNRTANSPQPPRILSAPPSAPRTPPSPPSVSRTPPSPPSSPQRR